MKMLQVVGAMLMLLPFSELSKKIERYCVYYNDEAPIEAFSPYDLIVLDSTYHPKLEGLIEQKKTLLGYISLGEVESERDYFEQVKAEGILLTENENWEGSFYVDMRDPKWTKRVIEELIPGILFQRFDGLFLDTLDNAGVMERSNPEKNKGMVQAAAKLVKTIRNHYPTIKIMMNRGYELLPIVGGDIDMVMGESIYTDYNFDKNIYEYVPEDLYLQQVESLQNAQSKFPHLKIYTLDYWKPNEPEVIKAIYQKERDNGFIPYVATVDLHKIIPEPR